MMCSQREKGGGLEAGSEYMRDFKSVGKEYFLSVGTESNLSKARHYLMGISGGPFRGKIGILLE